MKELNKKVRKLTAKQSRFCDEYMVDLNATQAAIRAGYSKKTASETSYENLRKPQISERISELQKVIAERNKISIDECVGILASMARFDIANLYDEKGQLKSIHDIDKETRLAIEGIDTETYTTMGVDAIGVTTTKKVKTSSRRANVIELMKHLGGYAKDNEQKKPVFDPVMKIEIADYSENENNTE